MLLSVVERSRNHFSEIIFHSAPEMHLSPNKISSGAVFVVAHLPGIASRAFVKIPLGFFLRMITFSFGAGDTSISK
jgi:hypothetical protein